jgi:hypothetical protein
MRISTLGVSMIIAGVNLLVAAFLLAILIPQLPMLVLSVILVGGFVVLMLGNFVSIFSGLSKKMTRRCTICQSDITGRAFPAWKNPHYELVHHDYSSWLKHSTKIFFLIAVPSIVILASSEFLWLTQGGVYSYFAGLTLVSWVVFGFSWPVYYWKKVRAFKRGWKDNHEV